MPPTAEERRKDTKCKNRRQVANHLRVIRNYFLDHPLCMQDALIPPSSITYLAIGHFIFPDDGFYERDVTGDPIVVALREGHLPVTSPRCDYLAHLISDGAKIFVRPHTCSITLALDFPPFPGGPVFHTYTGDLIQIMSQSTTRLATHWVPRFPALWERFQRIINTEHTHMSDFRAVVGAVDIIEMKVILQDIPASPLPQSASLYHDITLHVCDSGLLTHHWACLHIIGLARLDFSSLTSS